VNRDRNCRDARPNRRSSAWFAYLSEEGRTDRGTRRDL